MVLRYFLMNCERKTGKIKEEYAGGNRYETMGEWNTES